MSGCIGCANQPGDNGSLGGAAGGREGAVTPMVIGIITSTVAVFVLVVCALFYCVKLENNKYMAKIGDSGGGGGDRGADGNGEEEEEEEEEGDESAGGSVKSRPSSAAAAAPVRGGRSGEAVGASVGAVGGGKRRLFAWRRKSALPADNSPVTAIEMV